MENVKATWERRERSPIELSRKENFIIFEEDYKYESLDYEKIKIMLRKAKDFLEIVQSIGQY